MSFDLAIIDVLTSLVEGTEIPIEHESPSDLVRAGLLVVSSTSTQAMAEAERIAYTTLSHPDDPSSDLTSIGLTNFPCHLLDLVWGLQATKQVPVSVTNEVGEISLVDYEAGLKAIELILVALSHSRGSVKASVEERWNYLRPNLRELKLHRFWAPVERREDGVPEVSAEWLFENRSVYDGPLIDVREPGELTGGLGGLEKSSNLPLSGLVEAVRNWDRAYPVIIVSGEGERSGKAAILLEEADFGRVASLRGGMKAYRAVENGQDG